MSSKKIIVALDSNNFDKTIRLVKDLKMKFMLLKLVINSFLVLV